MTAVRDQTRHLLGPETRLEVTVAAVLCDSFENWQVQDLGIRGIVGLAEALVFVDLLKHLLLGDCVEGPQSRGGAVLLLACGTGHKLNWGGRLAPRTGRGKDLKGDMVDKSPCRVSKSKEPEGTGASRWVGVSSWMSAVTGRGSCDGVAMSED